MSKRIAFIGVGNIARRIIDGLIASGFDAQAIVLANRSQEVLHSLREPYPQIQLAESNSDALAICDIALLCVKPADMCSLCYELAATLKPSQVIISVAAGVSSASIAEWLGGHHQLVRCMPNTPVAVQQGVAAMYARAGIKASSQQAAQDLFSPIAMVPWIEKESDMSVVTALCGSGPAYFFALANIFEHTASNLDPSSSNPAWAVDILRAANSLWSRFEQRCPSNDSHVINFCKDALRDDGSKNSTLPDLYDTCVAYTLLFAQGLKDASCQALGETQASRMTYATLSGAFALAAQEGNVKHLCEEVTSKGGTTEYGLQILAQSSIPAMLESHSQCETEAQNEIKKVARQVFEAANTRAKNIQQEVAS